ncbi:two-component system sensor histidine kinase TctE [Palleronia aestuarii]|uniref:histidine kinase n=1 Tax=Palleronia aestuarii TaxID=568105 RepID=A0A2W7NCA5_9RHOB|nr:sensor histidine kinase [Palleronia aestuarii]PZX14364.1 two-component system sensor histidine kinase TctE [Palleronia aestuarii]
MRPPPLLSLRARLFAILLIALVATAVGASTLRFVLAREMSNRLYDSTLEVVALAISRDAVLSDGDILAEDLLDRLVRALGDPIYYRIIGPGGRFVTGYSEAPAGSPARREGLPTGEAVFYDGTYFDAPVRGVLQREFVTNTEFDGWVTVEVWQMVTERRDLALRLLGQTLAILAVVVAIAVLALTIGIGVGLRPLDKLSEAVSQRSPRDLAPITRPVPREMSALVDALNGLIAETREAFRKRDTFIADAAHQLRNPIAAVAAQLDAGIAAESDAERAEIMRDSHAAMTRVRRMTTQLLSLEALDQPVDGNVRTADLADIASAAAARAVPHILAAGGDIDFVNGGIALPVNEQSGLLTEMIDNLLDNVCKYGVRRGGEVTVSMARDADSARLTVADDGPGVPPGERADIFERFHRGSEDGHMGAGLGLAIARRIAEAHGGSLVLAPSDKGARFVVTLPIASA